MIPGAPSGIKGSSWDRDLQATPQRTSANMFSLISAFVLAVLTITSVNAHGYVSYPAAREVGPASVAACGKSVTDDIKRDNTSHVEGLPELAAKDPGYHADQ